MESMMISWIIVIIAVVIVIIQYIKLKVASYKTNKLAEKNFQQRLALINNYVFTENVLNSFGKHYPQLGDTAVIQVIHQLKNYFTIVLTAIHDNELQKSPKPILGMPSRVVDDLWHVFILDSRIYMAFCMECLGFYLHHHPADARVAYQRKQKLSNQLYRTWVYACQLENQHDLLRVETLPMLFQIDDVLNIPQGFSYELDDFLANARLQRKKTNDGTADTGCSSCSSCGGDNDANNNNYQQMTSDKTKSLLKSPKQETIETKWDDNTSSPSCSSCGGGGD